MPQCEKAFTVIKADLIPPNIKQWQVISPLAGSPDPLTVRFPAPLDHGLLAEFVRVQDVNGEKMKGQIELVEHETGWRFRPEEPWQVGPYALVVNTRLEDIARNNLHGLFDTPPEEKLTLLDKEMVTLAFQVE